LFVLPSYSEGFGIAVVEAMYQGIPCLCSKVGGIPEFIENGLNGWLFDPENINELADCIEYIYALPKNDLKKIAEKGKLYATDNFSNETYISKIEKIYETFIN
jgi:glycosyltransferase involved in cell wall biosynthesis